MKNSNQDISIDTTKYDKRLMGNVVRFPMEVSQCKGSKIFNAEVNDWLLDFWGDEGVCSLGYNTPEVLDAIQKFIATGHPHQLPDVYPNKYRWLASEIICNATGMDRVFFSNSGTEANEAAIKIARKFWYDKGQKNRYKVMTVEGNFHGRTGLSLAACDHRVSPYHRVGFGPIAQGFGVISPFYETQPDGTEDCYFIQCVEDGVEIENRPVEWGEVAAIILAPVLGNNLVKTYPIEFWDELEIIRDTFGVLIIYDDVQAGSGRAGHFATWQHNEILLKPNIMTLAKGMAMGFPMSAMLADESIAKSFTPGVHFNTFGGSPFVCHMATEMYAWLSDNIEVINDKGDSIRNMFATKGWIRSYDGYGMLNAFSPDFEKFGYDGFDFIHEARKHGLSLVTHRQYGPIRYTPPLNVDGADLQAAQDALTETHCALIGK